MISRRCVVHSTRVMQQRGTEAAACRRRRAREAADAVLADAAEAEERPRAAHALRRKRRYRARRLVCLSTDGAAPSVSSTAPGRRPVPEREIARVKNVRNIRCRASHFLPGFRSSARVCSSDVWAKLHRRRMRSLADAAPLSSFDG